LNSLPATLAGERTDATSYVAVSIRDNGIGMTKETLAQIFEPFFTTKEVNKGTGLGLSQVYGFVKQSGGEIDVDSRPGEGTTFTLYLPQVPLPAAQSHPVAKPDDLPRLDRTRVLLVEDNEKVGEFATGLLRELDQEVSWARDAVSALELLARRRSDFDLVFSDIVMPGMNGVEMAQEIRRRWPDLPVVLTSGYSHILAEDSNHGFELLQKPYSVDALIEALKRGGAEAGNAS
jgi:CheY-like chemotaxis protein